MKKLRLKNDPPIVALACGVCGGDGDDVGNFLEVGVLNKIINGDVLTVLKTLEPESVQCCVTSPPYWGLRNYDVDGQIGLEKTPEEYVAKMVEVFREVRRVLRQDGTMWLNLGDSYYNYRPGSTAQPKQTLAKHTGAVIETSSKRGDKIDGLKEKDLCGIPWRVAFALQADGWWLRSDIIWAKPNPMPESVTDRPTKSHEYIFLLTKSKDYFYDAEAVKENVGQILTRKATPTEKLKERTMAGSALCSGSSENSGFDRDIVTDGRNKRSVWTIATNPYPDAHFATFPEEIPLICIKAGSKEGDLVLEPFSGAGTTCMVAKKLNRRYVGIELNQKYVELAERRIETEVGTLL